ncbi:MAG: hypothetical protein EZS28_014340 [Streblomastix strix]|uniref:Tyr recombinase domain-containing protein n=1 Tax=Streblomastix strix TaxID=222440 RepID=A0A5J4W5F2_9EUKA|nr:MAG: hypothetical protein EZS28_014340 [Streblomastix strix]
MAVIVAICAARTTELIFMKQSEMIDDMHSFSLKTQTSKAVIRKAGITSPYTGLTIRHAMMTRLRAAGATQAEVNAFARRVIASNAVEIYQNKPIERDLTSMLIVNQKRYLIK